MKGLKNSPFKDAAAPAPSQMGSDQGDFADKTGPSEPARTDQTIKEVQFDTKVGKGPAPAMKKG